MFAAKSTWWIGAVAAFAASGCVMTSGNLSSSAERLERSAYDLSEEARTDDDLGGDFSRDAQEFAREARDFRRMVEDRDADDEDVQEAFGDLSERYHALRDEVDDENSRDAEIEFKDVTQAYLDVEREIRGDDDDDRYVSD